MRVWWVTWYEERGYRAMVEAESEEEALNLAASSDGRALVSGEELVINDSFKAVEVKP